MTKDILFTLPPGFEDNGQTELCLESMTVAGILSAFPKASANVDVRYQPIKRPRPEIVAMLGEENQHCPTLVLAEGSDAGDKATVQTAKGVRFLNNARDIAKYFAHAYGTPFPRA